MGKPVIRQTIDVSTGHGCWPPSIPMLGSLNVFVNGFGAMRAGDMYTPHCCVVVACHPVMAMSAGPKKTNINGLPVHTNGDVMPCGDTAGVGSPNVMAG